MRDSINKQIEQLTALAGAANCKQVDSEVSYALQNITYLAHDCLAVVTPRHSFKKKTAA